MAGTFFRTSYPATPAAGPTEGHTSKTQEWSIKDAPLPPLDYNLRAHRLGIAVFWSLVLIDSVAMPISLYFGLWYGTSLSPNAVFSIVTAALGGVSIAEYCWRLWKLVKPDSNCRCQGARRYQLDWFHWCVTTMWIFVIAELVVGTVFTNPPIRLLAMPLASALYLFGTVCIIIDSLRLVHVTLPFPISSQQPGRILCPAIYPYIEDIVAVDGGGGTAFRTRLSDRYEASGVFRQMLSRLSFFWGVGGEAAAVLTTVLVFALEKDAAYVVGWSLPFVWAGIWVLLTIWYVKKQLRRERELWKLQSVKA